MSPSPFYRKSISILFATLLVYASLVATHQGEFWPFSIYPMFSRGGFPWSRVLVREVPNAPAVDEWQVLSLDELPGAAFALEPAGISTNDLANFMARTRDWNEDRIRDLTYLFRDAIRDRSLLILRVDGRIDTSDSVRIAATPFALLTPRATVINPSLDLK